MSSPLQQTERTTMSRHDERGSYDRELAYAILDEALVAHVGLRTGHGVTVMPMTYARQGDELLLHGAVASRWLSGTEEGHPISVCVTLLDGLVLARSAFAHSMNYRSVIAFGQAHVVTGVSDKVAAFRALVEHLVPGRWDDCRQPDPKEIAATTVLSMRLEEASVKVRAGPPKDAKRDEGAPHWAGVIPLALTAGEAIADPASGDGIPAPAYTVGYARR